MDLFRQLGLNESILKAVSDLGFENPSDIQKKAIPVLLTSNVDMVALAQTGTGKTAAFGFPLLQKINAKNLTIQGLILSPTRELCLQIANELKLYSKYIPNMNVVAIYGGASIEEQARNVRRGTQIIVATPGRMQDMIRRKMVDISKIEYCVLDEADEMLNMGFYEDINDILSYTPSSKYTWLFSATMPKEVAKIASRFMSNPVEITVGTRNQASENIRHEYYIVTARHRYQALKRLADANPDIFSVVFCRTKRDTQSVAEKLIEDGYNAAALHGDLSQNQRDLVMKSFRSRQIQMLVATDVAARGIDVDDVTHVVHYQLPDEVEVYTHRSGRTGRAGKSGVSMVIISKSEVRRIKEIEKIIQQPFEAKSLPTGMEICKIQLYHLANSIKNVKTDSAIDDYLPAIQDVLKGLDREELIKKMVAVEFNRFYQYYKDSENIDINDNKENNLGEAEEVRYFINIGERDGYHWQSLKDFLKKELSLTKDEVFKVDVKNSFSFFNTEVQHIDKVMRVFNNFELNGRCINVEISKTIEKNKGKRLSKKRKEYKGRNYGELEAKVAHRKKKTSKTFENAFRKGKK